MIDLDQAEKLLAGVESSDDLEAAVADLAAVLRMLVANAREQRESLWELAGAPRP